MQRKAANDGVLMAEFGTVSELPGSAAAASICGGFLTSGLGDDGGDLGRKQINMSAEKGKAMRCFK